MTIPPRLSQLLALAEQGPTLRAALAEEVAELLADWPADYPREMRGMCERLLARAAQDADTAAKARPRARPDRDAAPAQALLAAAREGADVAAKLAQLLGVAMQVAQEILRDASCVSLAIAARAANLSRSDFSALVLLAHPGEKRAATYARLDAYDRVAAGEAARTLRAWRGKQAAAAE
jgi:hypothetical protein